MSNFFFPTVPSKDLYSRHVKTRACLGKGSFFMESSNSLPNDKILDWSKLKAFADDKINVTEKLKFVLGRVENIVGKGENAGNQKAFYTGLLKVWIVW